MQPKRLLLASHGSPGAIAAEQAALAHAAANALIHHLVVVPDFWKGMQGDDWLNNASTRDVFARYVESQLEQEVRENMERVQRQATERGLQYRSEVIVGNPAQCLLETAKRIAPDLIVVGTLRPKGQPGYRSRLLNDQVLRSLSAPLLVVPHP